MVTAAAPAHPPATAAVVLPPLPLLPQHLHAVLLDPPPHDERGDVAAPLPTRLAGVAAATAPTDTVVIVVRRAGTGGGAVLRDQAATRKTAVTRGSAGVAGVDLDPEREPGEERGPETAAAAVAAETETRRKKRIRRGKGAGMAETAVTVEAVSTNKEPPAKTERGGEKGVTAMRKTRKRRKRIGRKSQIKRRKNPGPKTRIKKGEALELQRRMVNQKKGKRVTHARTLRVTDTPGRTAKAARRAPPKLARDAQTLTQVGPLPPKLAKKRNLKNPNVVAQGLRKDLTSLVRRQAANTSLSHDQGSIRFFLFIFLLYVFIVCLNVISL